MKLCRRQRAAPLAGGQTRLATAGWRRAFTNLATRSLFMAHITCGDLRAAAHWPAANSPRSQIAQLEASCPQYRCYIGSAATVPASIFPGAVDPDLLHARALSPSLSLLLALCLPCPTQSPVGGEERHRHLAAQPEEVVAAMHARRAASAASRGSRTGRWPAARARACRSAARSSPDDKLAVRLVNWMRGNALPRAVGWRVGVYVFSPRFSPVCWRRPGRISFGQPQPGGRVCLSVQHPVGPASRPRADRDGSRWPLSASLFQRVVGRPLTLRPIRRRVHARAANGRRLDDVRLAGTRPPASGSIRPADVECSPQPPNALPPRAAHAARALFETSLAGR